MNYKKAIKGQIKFLKKEGLTSLSIKKLADHLGMQYTYLSRVLNSDHEHLKEDSLFDALNYLNFSDINIKLLMNYRIVEGSTSALRKKKALKEIALLESQKFKNTEQRGKVESKTLAEVFFMLDPLAIIVLAALSIPKFRKNTRNLATPLGVSFDEIKITLDRLETAELIERAVDGFEVKTVKSPRMHFKNDHQFMRIHQQQIKQFSNAMLVKKREDQKKSFMVTFASDSKTFDEIKTEFNKFITRVEELASDTKPEKIYQLNFDFFDWI